MSRPISSRRTLAAAVLVGLSCCALAAAAIAFTRLTDAVALLWMASSPLLAALCVWPRRQWWPFIVAATLGSIAASLAVSPYTTLAPVFALANTGEAVIAALLLHRMAIASSLFKTTRSVPLFVLAAGLVAPAISGLFIAIATGDALSTSFLTTWLQWLIGHGLGGVIGMPLALLVVRGRREWREFDTGRSIARALALGLLTAGVATATFAQDSLPLLFLPILPILIATFALRGVGAGGSIAIVTIVGGILTLAGHGPIELVRGDEALQLQFFQFYLGVLFVVALPVATTLIERDALMRALGASEARYRLVADHATDIMLTLDPKGRIEFVSPSIRELGYFEPAELVGRDALTLVAQEDRGRVRATHLQALQAPERTFRVEYRARKSTGETGWFETNTRAVIDASGTVTAVVSVIRDLGQRKAREQELERAASLDPMTSLLNREIFRRKVGSALHRVRRDPSRRATLALLDLDHFKAVNDVHGHAAGDTAILLFADLLRAGLGGDDQVGRIGGEEFAILFDGATAEEAAATCDRLRIAFGHLPIPCTSGSFRVTASIGIAQAQGGMQIDALFAQADAALYTAKREGRDCIKRAA